MAWGMLAKGAMGAIKGGAKKVAANKLLGRGKKKPQKPQQEGAAQEKGGALAIRPTTALVATGVVGGGALRELHTGWRWIHVHSAHFYNIFISFCLKIASVLANPHRSICHVG